MAMGAERELSTSNLAKEHNGEMYFLNREDGVEFIIELPIVKV